MLRRACVEDKGRGEGRQLKDRSSNRAALQIHSGRECVQVNRTMTGCRRAARQIRNQRL